MGARYLTAGIGGAFAAYMGAANVIVVMGSGSPFVPLTFLLLWMICGATAYRAPSVRKACQRLFFAAAAFSFLLPFSGVLSAATDSEPLIEGGSAFFVASLALVGFSLGGVFVALAVFVARTKQDPDTAG